MKIILSEIRPDGTEGDEQAYETGVIRIGRDRTECDIAYDSATHPMVSRRHAEIRNDSGRWYLVDLNATYGTYLDGRRTTAPERIHAGNIIQFGQDGPRLSVVWFEVFTDSVAPIPPKRSPEPANPTPVQGTPPIVPAPAEPPSPPQNTEMHARLRFADHPNEKPVEIIRAELTFGREPSCDVAFDADKVMVSRNHAVLRKKGAAVMIEDNGSFNGTFVNEQRIASPTQLFHNDQIRFGIGGPVLILDAPSLVAGPDDEPGYMSAEAIASLAAQFDLPDTGGSKTVVARIEKPVPGKLKDHSAPQLMTTAAFGDKKELLIGRGENNDIRLDGLQISTDHARLLRQGGEIVIDDLNSTNGVFLNGERVSRSPVTVSDRIQIGAFELRIDAKGTIGVFDTRSKTRIDAIKITKVVGSGSRTLKLLDDISLTIQPNEFVGLLGPSGAGKSTLMDALNGVRPPTGGSVLINNRDLYRNLDSLKQGIGYVPQDDIIHRELTVYRTLYYVAKLRLSRDVSSAEIDKTINEVMDVTGLSDRRDVAVSQLSGGQRKRVSIAVELITKPSMIFLDEPTSGLDPRTEERIMQLFRSIAESGRTVILTTHAMENVRLFDKIVVLMRGRLVYFGPPQDALKHLGAASFKELFDRLEAPVERAVAAGGEGKRREATESTADQWRQQYISSAEYKNYVAGPQSSLGSVVPGGTGKRSRLGLIGSIRQWMTLSRRYFEVLLKDKFNLFILLAQAPIIAILTYFIVGSDRPRDFIYFVLAIVSVWFGTSVAAREIVRERAVYSRERMVNLGILPYLASKFTVLGIIVAIQCILLFVPLKFFDLTGLNTMPGELLGIPQFWTMILTAAVGIALGLFISGVVKTGEMATSLVPLVLIPQILLSGIVGVPYGLSRPMSLFIPAAWSFDTMKRFSTLDTLEKEGSDATGKNGGLGLYKQIEADNDKIIADARKDLEDYKAKVEKNIKQFEDAKNAGLMPSMEKPGDLPPMPNAKKLPKDLSGYVTFLHPWMHEVVNQFVLMLMFGLLAIATLILLKLRDVR